MKNHCVLAVSLVLSVASCAAQSDVNPAPPADEAVAATPPKPAKPAIPAAPAPSEAVLKEQSKQLKLAADQIKKAEMQFVLADPFGDRDDGNRTLVLSREGHEPKDAASIEQDLNVMARILEKASTSHDERTARAIGIYYRSPFGSSAAPVRNMYLEGYGAIFFLNVNYSLTPPPIKSEEKPAEKDDRDAEWENTRRELEQPRNGNAGAEWVPKEPGFGADAAATPAYDAQRVETLQKDLAQALRNAVHIQDLKSGETVTVIVTGRSAAGKRIPARVHRSSSDRSAELSTSKPTATVQQRLIIRAKKSDIEAFQNEKLSFDEFRKRLLVSLS